MDKLIAAAKSIYDRIPKQWQRDTDKLDTVFTSIQVMFDEEKAENSILKNQLDAARDEIKQLKYENTLLTKENEQIKNKLNNELI